MRQRLGRIDLLRALAMVWMTVYHFCFDLDHFGLIEQDFYRDPFWTWQRTAIVSLFLFCAGLGQAIAVHQGQGWPRFWRRWAQVAGCALLVLIVLTLATIIRNAAGRRSHWPCPGSSCRNHLGDRLRSTIETELGARQKFPSRGRWRCGA